MSAYRFLAGNTYRTERMGGISVAVQKRTASSIICANGKRYKIHAINGDEFVFPLGQFSMAPVLRAENRVVAEFA